ncbi:hypothetical protein [Candidatus Nanohalobium constans]|uniref:Uncharacterized protein n=1 Tax=Candidatus Nanohalobium constans TaxID=2565781 RepID=A0A5Q0UGS1_9ARCH|nr:hypothetical protein [Candidatus Nanohalobium constans]QGA80853.1 hypothetical protein LC1Nh_0972 [Candidatus Nanohalobium constans]
MSVKTKMDKVRKSIDQRRGNCVICGDRVHNSDDYIESTDGYCHKECLIARKTGAAAEA